MLCVCTGINAQCKCSNDSMIVQYCSVMYNVKSEAIVNDMHTSADFYIVDNSGRNVVFKTPIALMNYMAEQKWVYVEQIPSNPVIHFIFKKVGKKNDNWFKGLKLKQNNLF